MSQDSAPGKSPDTRPVRISYARHMPDSEPLKPYLRNYVHARAVAADVQRHAAALRKNDSRGALAEAILREAAGRLSQPIRGTALRPNRARLIRALYTRLDRLTESAPATT